MTTPHRFPFTNPTALTARARTRRRAKTALRPGLDALELRVVMSHAGLPVAHVNAALQHEHLSHAHAKLPAAHVSPALRRAHLKHDSSSYTGPVIHAVDYAPTWQGWDPVTPKGQPTNAFFDSDFANDGMAGLWGPQGRNDLGTIAADGFNVVRLYDWSPSRGDSQGADNAHLAFLNYAYSLKPSDGYSQHLLTMVPVSAYFLSNDQYAWSGGNSQGYTDPVLDGQVNYSFDAAPQAIQTDLTDFIKSITVNGSISPDVFAVTVGNEVDQTFQDQAPNGTANGAPIAVDAASKLARTEWWMVNLEQQLSRIPGGTNVKITSPISTADLDRGNLSWFQAFVNGVKIGDTVPAHAHNPTNTEPGAQDGPFEFFFEPNGLTVSGSIPGLASIPASTVPAFTNWYINSYQPYQNPTGLKNLFLAYDKAGKEQPPVWNWNWPGQAFSVPLLFTETGIYRSQFDSDVPPADKGRATDLTHHAQLSQSKELIDDADAIEKYIKAHRGTTEAMGWTLFEFNDEPTRKSGSEATFGMNQLAATQPKPSLDGIYPQATQVSTATTNLQYWAGGTLNPKSYPVQKLFPVRAGEGKSLGQKLQKVFHRDQALV